MATLLEDIHALLSSFDAVTAIVGATIRPGELAEADTLPAIVFTIERQTRAVDLQGVAGLVTAEIAIACISENVIQAWQIHEAVRTNGTDPGTGLAGFIGTAGSRGIKAHHGDDDYATNDPDDDSDLSLHSAIGIYHVDFNETT